MKKDSFYIICPFTKRQILYNLSLYGRIVLLMKELMQILQEEFHEKIRDFMGGVEREARFPAVANKIKVAIGMRRTGKTFFLLQKAKYLINANIPLSRILYINFEDDRLYPLVQEKLIGLIDAFYSLYPENHDLLCYIFLDEIQNVEQWPLVVRRYFDSKKVELYLTGSSAKLLSKEIASALRGRSLSTEIWPFSFHEYLKAHQLKFDQKIMGKKAQDQLQKYLYQYLIQGGFPEVTGIHESERLRILQDYVNVVIFRDIIERYQITNIVLIRYMIKALLKQVGSSFSVNKFYNDLKSQGFAVAKTTVHEYLSYIEDAYLAFSVPLYTESLRKSQTNLKKIYAIDTGLVSAYTFSFSENLGRLFENVVYLDLRRRGHKIYYYLTEARHEVDFITRDKLGKLHLYQVVWNTDDVETMKREIRALREAEKELKIKGEIITPHYYISDFIQQKN